MGTKVKLSPGNCFSCGADAFERYGVWAYPVLHTHQKDSTTFKMLRYLAFGSTQEIKEKVLKSPKIRMGHVWQTKHRWVYDKPAFDWDNPKKSVRYYSYQRFAETLFGSRKKYVKYLCYDCYKSVVGLPPFPAGDD